MAMLQPRNQVRGPPPVMDRKEFNATRPRTADQPDTRTSFSTVASHPMSTATSTRSRRSSITTSSSAAQYSINHETPHLTRTPWEIERHRRTALWRRTKAEPAAPTVAFKKLPREVYDCIMVQLEQLHFAQEQNCPSCYLKDLYNLSLTNRAWDRAATLQMYRKVLVLSNDDYRKVPVLKIKGAGRLKLLRRTLRERQGLARCVRELHLSDIHVLYQNASIEREEIVNLVASLVLACPNLERIVGFHIPYTQSFDRLSQALSTRRNLTERVWLLSDGTGLEPDEEEDESTMYYHPMLDPTERFLELNSNQSKLRTLVIHQQSIAPRKSPSFRAVMGTIRQLISLRHLSLSGLLAQSFTNLALNALPPYLQSLRLENLPGVNDKGLLRLSNSSIRASLRDLALIDLEIGNLTIISNFLSPQSTQLRRFTLSQHKAPHLPPQDNIPFFKSKTLVYAHWEIRSQASPASALLSSTPSKDAGLQFPFANSEPISCLATSLLARSIKNLHFPSLRRLRAPHDPQGLLQSLCKPLATALLASETLYNDILASRYDQTTERPHPRFPDLLIKSSSDRTDSAMSSPMSSEFAFHKSHPSTASRSSLLPISQTPTTPTTTASTILHNLPSTASPPASRLAAQSRILFARKQPLVNIHVTDPYGTTRINKPIYGFMGKLDSEITYDLRPDRQRALQATEGNDSESEEDEHESSQWITDVGDVVGEWEVVLDDDAVGNRSCGHSGRRVTRSGVLVQDLF